MKWDKQYNYSLIHTSTCTKQQCYNPPMSNWMSRLHTNPKRYKTKYTLYKNIGNCKIHKGKCHGLSGQWFISHYYQDLHANVFSVSDVSHTRIFSSTNELPVCHSSFWLNTQFSIVQLVEHNARNGKVLSLLSRKHTYRINVFWMFKSICQIHLKCIKILNITEINQIKVAREKP